MTSSSSLSGRRTSTSAPSASAAHATPDATGAMAVTAALFPGDAAAAPPHWQATSVSHAPTSPASVPVHNNALDSSAAIAVTSPKHAPAQNSEAFFEGPRETKFGASTARRDCRNKSNALSVFVRLLLHQSSAPSAPAAHITRTFPPMIQCDAPPRSRRLDLSGPALSLRMLVAPVFDFWKAENAPFDVEPLVVAFVPESRFLRVEFRDEISFFARARAPPVVPPAPSPPTAPVRFHS